MVLANLHESHQSIAVLKMTPSALLLSREPILPTLGIDTSYAAMAFVGQNIMASTRNGILNHSFDSFEVENIYMGQY